MNYLFQSVHPIVQCATMKQNVMNVRKATF